MDYKIFHHKIFNIVAGIYVYVERLINGPKLIKEITWPIIKKAFD
jgi:hypothetical protein